MDFGCILLEGTSSRVLLSSGLIQTGKQETKHVAEFTESGATNSGVKDQPPSLIPKPHGQRCPDVVLPLLRTAT